MIAPDTKWGCAAGIVLTALFFSPLAGVPNDQRLFLFWRHGDSIDLIVACIAMSLAIGFVVSWSLRSKHRHLAALLICGIWFIPLTCLTASVVRLLPGVRWLLAPTPVAMGLAFMIAMLAAAIIKHPLRVTRLALDILPVCVPATVVVGAFLVSLMMARSVSTTFGTIGPEGSHARGPNILVLVFDELSYNYLFDGTSVGRHYPAFHAAALRGVSYTQAKSPGGRTLLSLPGYLAGKRFARAEVAGGLMYVADSPGGPLVALEAQLEDGPCRQARAAGYRTEISGYYLPYCDLLKSEVDACRTISEYNSNWIGAPRSVWSPIWTNLSLLPHQFPTGLIKNPIYSYHQKAMTAAIIADAQAPFTGSDKVFRFIHLSIPHAPFVYDRDGFRLRGDPFVTTNEAYADQLRYTDTVLAGILNAHASALDNTRVVITADHELRANTAPEENDHVPLFVLRTSQPAAATVDEPTWVSDVVRQVISSR